MKKFVSILLVTIVTLSLFTGCASPMDDYRKTVESSEVESLVGELDEMVDNLHTMAIDLEAYEMDMDAESADELIAGLPHSEIVDLCGDIDAKVAEVKSVFADVDLSDEEVEKLHGNLTVALEIYKEMTADITEVIDMNIDFMVYAFDLQVAAVDFGAQFMTSMMSLSATYQTAFMENSDQYLGEFEALNSPEFEEMMDSGDVDEAFVADAIQRFEAMKTTLLELLPENDTDQSIQDIIIGIADDMIGMMNFIVDNKETIGFMQEFEDLKSYILIQQTDAEDSITVWTEGLEEE